MEPLSVAPMMDVTDRHFRWIARRIAPRARLYSEMVTTGALLHGDRERFLSFDASEHPVALQLGGDDPAALAECARMAEGYGYDEINLNVGCPSPRVQRGAFGVSLMGRPQRVAEAVAAMQAAVRTPVTVKHRIGFDDLDRYEDMLAFVVVIGEVEFIGPGGEVRGVANVHTQRAEYERHCAAAGQAVRDLHSD